VCITSRCVTLGIACILVVAAVTVSAPSTGAMLGGLLQQALNAEDPESSSQRTPDHPGDPWSPSELITPEELLKETSGKEEPLVFHVGVPTLFKNGHIPGSRHTGQASTLMGMEELKRQVQELPRTKSLVLYCGCCPWKDCPNIRPAFKALQQMKFTHLRVLYLANNFGVDWIRKGFPIEK
jgi:thiosulfate/3-mercaptopyruvate sulfurtransferase